MATGLRLLDDSGLPTNGMRNPFPPRFPTDIMFRDLAHFPFSHVQFVPERIVEFSVSPEGLRYYKVQWQQTWVPEHQILPFHNIVEVFWQNHNNVSVSLNNNQSKPVIVSGGHSCNPRTSANLSKPLYTESFLSTLQSSGDADLVDPALTSVSSIIEKPSQKDVVQDNDCDAKKSLAQEVGDSDQPSTSFGHSSQHLVSNDTANTDFAEENGEREQPNGIISGEDNGTTSSENQLCELTSKSKRKELTTIQCDGFSIVNVENSSVSEEDIRIQAREVLCSFDKKRPRCPNGSSNLPHACFFCKKVLSSRKKLREHQFSIHFKNVGDFACEICQQRFAFPRKLKAHMMTHSDNRSFACEICGLTCKRKTHLNAHMDTHNKESNYRCDVCHKNFKVQADLKTHCLSEHKNQKTTCNVCKQTLLTGFSVYVHSMRHSGTRDHLCEVCGAVFKSKHHLTAHQKTHSGAGDEIECPVCGEGFSEKKYVRNHIDVYHKELASKFKYDYICSVCDKDFAYKGRLDEHMKTHAEETPEELNTRLKASKKKKAESLSEDDLAKFGDKVEKIINSQTGEMKLKCKLCRHRDFRLISRMEKHLQDHEADMANKVTSDDAVQRDSKSPQRN